MSFFCRIVIRTGFVGSAAGFDLHIIIPDFPGHQHPSLLKEFVISGEIHIEYIFRDAVCGQIGHESVYVRYVALVRGIRSALISDPAEVVAGRRIGDGYVDALVQISIVGYLVVL